MRAKAIYKGQVADDAYLHDPVNADIDYTYTQSSNFRGTSGALATPSTSNVDQHVTIQFLVSQNAMDVPSFGAFSGGDPTQGHYSEAFSVGSTLAYWAGVYYSIAEAKWRQGQCVKVVFNPLGNTVQPVLGSQLLVSAQFKTKAGESVDADVHAEPFAESGVTPGVGRSSVDVPIKFTYTAPGKKMYRAGFRALASTTRTRFGAER